LFAQVSIARASRATSCWIWTAMADEMEQMLRNSLDAVDRGRRWAILGVAALLVAAALLLFAAIHTGRMTDDSGSRLLFHELGAQILFVAGCTAVVMMPVKRMTKAILRALDLKK
jgi:hypothetical protein